MPTAIFSDRVVAELLDVVDGSGNVVAVTAPNQVNLASAGLRLAKHQPRAGSTDGGDEREGPGEETERPGDGPTAGRSAERAEQQFAFTFTRNLLTNPTEADRLADLFKVLYVALDERTISHLQSTVQIVLDPATGEKLRQRLAELGVQATTKDM